MLIKLVISGALLLFLLPVPIHSQDFAWTRTFGAAQWDQASSVAVDDEGNVYTAGVFIDTIDFDPGSQVYNLTSQPPTYNTFVSKMDKYGHFLWVQKICYSPPYENDPIIALDSANNLYVTGSFGLNTFLDSGSGVQNLTTFGLGDIFILKLSTDGQPIWLKQIGGPQTDLIERLAVDQSGNVYLTGYLNQGMTDFDPGPGVYNLGSSGGYDTFVCRLTPNGEFVWAKKVEGTDDQQPGAIAADAHGYVYVTGEFEGYTNFDPGFTNFSMSASTTHDDVFVAKWDSTGNFIWAKKLGGINRDQSRSIDIDNLGNVYTTGEFRYNGDFDPGSGVYTLVAQQEYGIFVSKLDSNGNFIWAKTPAVGNGWNHGMYLSLDSSANIHLVGWFEGLADFDPGPGISTMNAEDGLNTFALLLDSSGVYQWAVQLEGLGDVAIYCGDTDSEGNTYLAGYFEDTTDFDPGVDEYLKIPNGYRDIYITKLGPACTTPPFSDYNLIPSHTTVCSGESSTILMSGSDTGVYYYLIDASDNEILDGPITSTGGSVAFNTGIITNPTYYSVLVSDGSSCVRTLTDLPTINTYPNTSVDTQFACDSIVWMDGQTYSANNTTATHILTSSFGCDSVVTLNLTVNYSTSSVNEIVSCDSIVWIDGQTYTSSNSTATHMLTTINGCDSLVILNLSIYSPESSVDMINACDSIVWIDGQTYTSSNNTATHTLSTINGCDSLVTLNLSIYSTVSSVDVINACDSIVWIDGQTYTSSNNTATHTLAASSGCDSVITLNLSLNESVHVTDEITSCTSIVWIDGLTYSSSNNTATYTLTTFEGCDSIVNLDLTIHEIDANVQNNSPTLTSNSENAMYQWVDCDDQFAPITNETNQSFTALENGNYAVIVTVDNCVDTSDCIQINNVALLENHDDVFSIFPNPTEGTITIDFASITAFHAILVRDALGTTISSVNIPFGSKKVTLELPVESGIYFLTLVSTQEKPVIRKITKLGKQ